MGTAGSGEHRQASGRGFFARAGMVVPAAAMAAVIVGAVAAGAELLNPNGRGAASLTQAIGSLTKSKQTVLLEQIRHQVILMNAATGTLTTESKPATVMPAKVMAAMTASTESSSSPSVTSSSSGSSSSSASTTSTATDLPADAARDQATAQSLMPSFGFSVSSQWSCLDDLWNQESSWNYTAENASSGAFGIPQANPGSKMASVGSDWQTDPATQIKWGLEYIQGRYGTPCGAWAMEESAGSY